MKKIFEIRREEHETKGFPVSRPQGNLSWIKPEDGDGVEEIVKALKEVLVEVRPHLANCPPTGKPGHLHCVTYFEISPLPYEHLGLFLECMRREIHSPEGQQLELNNVHGGKQKLTLALMTPFVPANVQQAPESPGTAVLNFATA